MNVCSIFSDSSLHDWALKTQLFFSTVVILFGLCCASQGSSGSGILWDPSPISPIGLLFGLLTLADWPFLFLYGILKPFPVMGIPILWTFFILLFFFFFFFHYKIALCYFSLGLGLWLILNLNSFKGSNYLLIVTHVYFHQLDILNINTKTWTVVECLLSTFNSAVSFYKLAFEHACECILRG